MSFRKHRHLKVGQFIERRSLGKDGRDLPTITSFRLISPDMVDEIGSVCER